MLGAFASDTVNRLVECGSRTVIYAFHLCKVFHKHALSRFQAASYIVEQLALAKSGKLTGMEELEGIPERTEIAL